MKKKILILNDRIGLKDTMINLGDRALSVGLYKLLENSEYEIISGGWKNFPYFTIRHFNHEDSYANIEKIFNKWFDEVTSVPPSNVKRERKIADFLDKNILFNNYFFQKIDEEIKYRFSRGIIETIKPFLLKKYYSHQLIEKIKNADLVIYNAASLNSDRHRYYLPMGLFECFLAKKLGKKVIAANQTVDIVDPLNFKIVSFVYKSLDLFTTREPCSNEILSKMGLDESKIISSCDSAFAADFHIEDDINEITQNEGIIKGDIGVIIRGDNKSIDYKTWTDIIDHIQNKCNKQVFLLFTCIAHDEIVYKKLSTLCSIKKLSAFYDYPILINLMRCFDCIITDRYHPMVFSILAHTPVIPINPSFRTIKTEGLFSLFDYPIPIVKYVNQETYDQIINNITYIENHKKEIKETLSKVSSYLRNKGENDIKTIFNTISMN